MLAMRIVAYGLAMAADRAHAPALDAVRVQQCAGRFCEYLAKRGLQLPDLLQRHRGVALGHLQQDGGQHRRHRVVRLGEQARALLEVGQRDIDAI